MKEMPKPMREALERFIHAFDHAAQIDADVRGEFGVGNGLWIDLVAKRAEILTRRRDVDIDDALDLIVVDFGGRHQIHQLHDGIESGGLFQIRRAQRNLLQIDQIVDRGLAVFGILDAEEVIVAGFVIDPVVGRDHDVRIQRGDDVVDNLFLGESEFGGMHAVDIHADGRIVHVLRNVDLADAGKFANAARPDPARSHK